MAAAHAQDVLAKYFAPRSIAVIGASADPTKIGGRPLRYLRLGGFEGRVLPVNPARATIQDFPAYPSLDAIDGDVDLAIVAVPALGVEEAVAACARKGVAAATIFSAGFAETGPDGTALQERIAATARAGGVRLLGPNCMGTINTANGALATFTSGIVDEAPARGRISLASQSGAFGAHCFILAGQARLGINLWATTGNQIDLDVADFLAYMVTDPGTDVILGCIEGVRNASRLIEAFALARSLKKPVILMKVGRSEVGAEAAASHTASLGGSDTIFGAVLRQYGVHRAHSIDEMFDVAYACSRGRFPTNRDLGLITVSGGVGILMADEAAECGLDVSALPGETQAFLKEKVPFAGTRNPLDVTAQIINDPDLVGPMFRALIADGGHGSVIAFLTHLGRNPAMMARLMPGLAAVAAEFPDRLLVISLLADPEVRIELEALGYVIFEDPTRAVRAVSALARLGALFQAGPAPDQRPIPSSDAVPVEGGRAYSEVEAKRMLASAGIPVVEAVLVGDAGRAIEAARRLGYPVVLKIASPDIPHKSEIGGVLLGVGDDEAVRSGFATLLQRATVAAPAARIEGVIVAPMIGDGVETILGIVSDPAFGPCVMFGLGGIFTEVFQDVTFRVAPIGPAGARSMLAEIKGRALLQGARGRPCADEDAVVDALVRLSAYADANRDTLASIDVNPFMVRPVGQGGLAVDALIVARTGREGA